MVFSGSASAASIAPGGSLGPPPLDPSPPLGVLASTTGGGYTLKDAGNNIVGTGTYTASVYSPDTATGKTTITFSLAVLTGEIEHVTLTNFAGFTTDVTEFGPGQNATGVQRSGGSGGIVSFDFISSLATPGGDLEPGEFSNTFVIRTNAPTFTGGFINFIDGGTGGAFSFSPASVPLPATASMGLALIVVLERHAVCDVATALSPPSSISE